MDPALDPAQGRGRVHRGQRRLGSTDLSQPALARALRRACERVHALRSIAAGRADAVGVEMERRITAAWQAQADVGEVLERVRRLPSRVGEGQLQPELLPLYIAQAQAARDVAHAHAMAQVRAMSRVRSHVVVVVVVVVT